MTQEEKFRDMTTAPVNRLILKLSLPTIASMLVTSFYNMADTYFVGKINTQATAAVGVVFSLMAVIQALGFMFGHGSGNFIARKLGEKKQEEANQMVSCAFFMALIAGTVLMILGLIFLEPLAYLLGSTDTILPYSKDYLRIILCGAPYMMASLVLNNQIRYQGNAVYAMLGIVSGAVINLCLDPLLIFTFDMGISGAALATILSQLFSFLLLLYATTRGGNIRISFRRTPFSSSLIKEMLSGGMPSLFRQGLASISVIFLNTITKGIAGADADAAIAGISIVSRITMFANSALIGFGQGFQPVCSYNFGARLYARVKEAFWFCVKYSFFFLVVIAAVAYFFAPQLVGLFRKEDAMVAEIGTLALRLQCLTFPLNAWIVMCNMMLQASGQSMLATLVAGCRQGICFLPVIFTLPFIYGIFGVQVAQPVADIFTLAVSLWAGIYFLKKLGRLAKERE